MNARVTLPELRREVVRACRSMHARGWVAGFEGGVTAMTADGKLLATPPDASAADVRETDLLLLDRGGRPGSGTVRTPAGLPMHVAVFASRPDVGAVVHAHPPASSAFAAAGRPVEARFLPAFVVATGGVVPVVPFAMEGSEALSGLLQPFLEPHDVVLLGSQGVLAWGPDPAAAVRLVEHCEAAARILLDTASLGGPRPLPEPVVRLLLDRRTREGLGPSGRARAKALP